ncbi:Serine/threonine-protein kinase ATR [Psilocybe cubensis]|uniref:Serine/threonine-protein kinase ATR n=1 Tax=Psilocybe cubensis TaxID=181762 RepID=A0ACB8H2U7_PSICU|nr:Serine/threonine-protein kinase ATR [Psilocybe cubensis]KAH9482313.1 Serine/threonine-protein kinase ATR [Psilocybe cubensis]
MNSASTSTLFQISGLDGADNPYDPASFTEMLKRIAIEDLGDNPSQKEKSNPNNWVQILDGITDHLLGPFPDPSITAWEAMEEKVTMTEAALQVIQRAFSRVVTIYDASENLVKKLLARLLDLYRILDSWTDSEQVDIKDFINPKQMKELTLMKPRIVAVDILEPIPENHSLNVLIFPSNIPTFVSLVLEVIVKAICPSLPNDYYFLDIGRSIAEFSRKLLVHYLNPGIPMKADIRTKLLRNIISSTEPLWSHPVYRPFMGDLVEYLLQIRLEAGLDREWDPVDQYLIDTLKSNIVMSSSYPMIRIVIQRLQIYNGKDSERLSELLWAYLQYSLRRMEPTLISVVKKSAESLPISPERDIFLEELTKLTTESSHSNAVQHQFDISSRVWSHDVRQLVEEIIAPDTLSWMDEEETSASQLCKRALLEIQSRFERREIDPSAASRPSIISKMGELQCLLALCNKSDCLSQNTHNNFLSIREYAPLIKQLLNGTVEEVTPDCRRKLFIALGYICKHHSGKEDADVVIDYIFRGMTDTDRSVRLSAGRALNGLVQIYGLCERPGVDRVDLVFNRLYDYFQNSQNAIRETLLITVGCMGLTANFDILGKVLCLLVAQLGRQNPIIKGVAGMHIIALAKHFKKSVYSLLAPYMNDIAPYIFKQLPLQPELLGEVSHVMGFPPRDFIRLTLPYTLPMLFATNDVKGLNKVAKELSTKVSALILNHSSCILAHIFLLPGQSAAKKALTFIAKILTDASTSSIDIPSVVRSCVVPLLADLVIEMGDENSVNAQQAVKALKRVEEILSPDKKNISTTNSLEAFLKDYILGVISTINDMLQDVQGKKSVTVKRKILRSLGSLIEQMGAAISAVSPQIMATFQTMLCIPELSEITLESWYKFATTLDTIDLGPYIGPTSAAIVSSWSIFSPRARNLAFEILEYIICTMGNNLRQHLTEVIDISVVQDLQPLYDRLQLLRGTLSPGQELDRILNQSSSDNITVATQALQELKSFLSKGQKEFIRTITSGDVFHPYVGRILGTLLATASRDIGDNYERLHLLAFECIGALGAVDPDRCEIPSQTTNMVVFKNFTDENENLLFALHLIQDLIVGAFLSTSNIRYQTDLAYSIQELLKFCQFTPALVTSGRSTAVPIRVRNRWNALPKHVLETVTPLLGGKFKMNDPPALEIQQPIYPTQSTYREWLQLWSAYLITKVSGTTARQLFGAFSSIVRNKDVVIAHHLLPHLVLNILLSGNGDYASCIREEIVAVLEDQIDSDSRSTSDKKLLSAQAVFMLLDHLNKWVRHARQEIVQQDKDKKNNKRLPTSATDFTHQLALVDSVLMSINQNLMAKAAFKCKAFARSLMSFEQQAISLANRGPSAQKDLPEYYEKLHEIYSQLDEPDGMEGISTLILSPTLEHQIRQHESTGRWTSAQSCWEVRLQESPDNVDYHVGLLRCLRNLGHYDTLRTHVIGVLTRHPDWEEALAGFQVESAWMAGAWGDVQKLVDRIDNNIPAIATGRVLLAMRNGDKDAINKALSQARLIVGSPIIAAGAKGYRRSYEAALDLHLIHELELIYQSSCKLLPDSHNYTQSSHREILADLSQTLSARLNTTLPTYRSREPLLSMRRAAFALPNNTRFNVEIGKSWLASAKIARKAKQWQTAYSAMLQARQRKTLFSMIESAKLLQGSGHTLSALFELENSLKLVGLLDDHVVDLTSDASSEILKSKTYVLRARWMHECDRFSPKEIIHMFTEAISLQPDWESAHYHLGHFHEDCFKRLPESEFIQRGLKMNLQTLRAYSKAVMHGSKFVYQTVPRMLSIWMDLADDKNVVVTSDFKRMTESISIAMKEAPVYKWFTAFPQIVSRVQHDHPEVYRHLRSLISVIIQEYPLQALWLFASVVKSTNQRRSTRGNEILSHLRNNPRNQNSGLSALIDESMAMTNELLALCDHPLVDERPLNMTKDFPRLKRLGRSKLIVPLQESLTASLPPTSATESTHQPFASNLPTFQEFLDEIEVMKSLAKPRKITIRGSNGQRYMFLGKPKDDLRKDARLMDMFAIINKLLKRNSESRRRQLHIRSYGVVALNEECGFIQWVPKTTPIRYFLGELYSRRGIPIWSPEVSALAAELKRIDADEKKSDADLVKAFKTNMLGFFPPVFHEWFIDSFPEPSAWLASRLTYGRTAAVMSMIGWVLGLGDRHCENILLDSTSGDVVHVDFNCLFEKGKKLDTPERVPFRLTQNIVDGLGISGVEGAFRISAEITLQLLRDNKDSLMSVLDTFIHDPLAEWEDEKRKMDRQNRRAVKNAANNSTKPIPVTAQIIARLALRPIEKKFDGIHVPQNNRESQEREIGTANLVQMLIAESSDPVNLAKMYAGWAPWL